MRIRAFEAHIVQVPLKRPFRHASAVRQESRNLVIGCSLENGIVGWGEGVPREYVTGETPDGALRTLGAMPLVSLFAHDCNTWSDIVSMLDAFTPQSQHPDPRGCTGNALRAAVEMSLLDAFGKAFKLPVHSVIEAIPEAAKLKQQPTSVRYSTTIDSSDPRKLWRKALLYRLYGFRQCKVKVGEPGQNDPWRIQTIRRWFGPRVDLRLDANEAWSPSNYLANLKALAPYDISCIEQPLPHEQLAELAVLRDQLSIPVMLDESLTSWYDAEQAIKYRACDLLNLRLSKCGGMIRCWRLAALAHQHGLGYQLGCHPGETGILSAAGRHWAQVTQGIRYLEGSYDRHLLKSNLIDQDLTFGYGGKAPAIMTDGLGVTVNLQQLKQISCASQTFNIA